MERKLIDYLPLFIQDYAEIKAIMDAEQTDVVKTWSSGEDVMNDQFVLDATENGVKRWENMLDIVPKATHTLDERKFTILSQLNAQLPYTLELLKRMLTVLCGEDGYTLKLNHNKYELNVKVALSNKNNVEAVQDVLDRIVPANLVKNITLLNTHGFISDLTHGYLSNYTHKGVREENL